MIKCTLKVIILLFLVSLLFGCNAKNVSSMRDIPTISATKLTEREKELLNSIGVESKLIFDVNLSGMKASKGKIWVDRYEKSQFKGPLAILSSSISVEEKPPIYHAILAIQRPDAEWGKQKWFLSFGSGTTTVLNDIQKDSMVVTSVKVIEKKGIEIDKDIKLGIIVQGKQAANIPADIFENEESMKELFKNDLVYILRCRFN